jgi:hypothetical protein
MCVDTPLEMEIPTMADRVTLDLETQAMATPAMVDTVTLDLETPAMAATAATVNLDTEIVPAMVATVDTVHLIRIHPITIQTDLMEVHNHPTLKELQLFAFGTKK